MNLFAGQRTHASKQGILAPSNKTKEEERTRTQRMIRPKELLARSEIFTLCVDAFVVVDVVLEAGGNNAGSFVSQREDEEMGMGHTNA